MIKITSTNRLPCAAAFCVLLAGVAGRAQSSPGAMQQSAPTPPSAQAGQGTMAPATAENPQSMDDKDFVHKALQGGSAEVELGQLAAQKAQSDDVKQFARKMVEDHSQLADQVMKPLAKQLGVAEPNGLSKKDKTLKASLEKLSGAEFDQAYIKAMLKDHKEDLKDFKEEASMSQDPSVKKAAEQGETVISQHLQMIEQIAQKHDVAMNGKGQ